MDVLTILGFLGWWIFGVGVDVATHWAIFKNFNNYDVVSGLVVGIFGPLWALVCILALYGRERDGNLKEFKDNSDDEDYE